MFTPMKPMKRAEVEQLSTELIAHGERARQCQSTHQQDVIARDMGPGIDHTEEAAGNGIVAAHAVKQAARGEVRARTGTDRGDQRAQIYDVEERRPPAWPAMKTNAVSTSGKPS